jgi:hypothetical protein
MFLLTSEGIQEMPKKKAFKALFCKHLDRVSGRSCSSIGLVRISGEDLYEVCRNCGKILGERHTQY